ncbi:DUF4760 domain-containing protein [Lysobacter sp. P5_B9]
MHLDFATALNIISTFAIVGALIFTGLQVREVNTARREQASVAMIVTTQSISVDLLSKLPENASTTDIGLSSPETQRALFEFGVRLETIGYMVHQRMVRLATVDDLMGGVTLVYWSRAKAWVEAERERTGNPKLFEWCQWVATQITKRHAKGKDIPAYLRDMQWRE